MIRYMERIGTLALLAFAVIGFAIPASAATAIPATVYASNNSQAPNSYASHLDKHGFHVKVIKTNKLGHMEREYGVPSELEGNQLTLVGGYAVIGHVPVNVIDRLLRGHPAVTGIAVASTASAAPITGIPGMGNQDPPIMAFGISGGYYTFGNIQPSLYAAK